MRHLVLLLMLSTAVALADDKTKTKHSAESAEAHKQTEAVDASPQGKMQGAQGKTEEPATSQAAQADTEEPATDTDQGAKLTSVPGSKALGMSILGNQDAPKSLVIVPWKSSELGDSPGISPMLDDSRQPVDKDVFMRALRYYEIRSGKKN